MPTLASGVGVIYGHLYGLVALEIGTKEKEETIVREILLSDRFICINKKLISNRFCQFNFRNLGL